MIVIFGYHPVHKTIGPVKENECPRCNNTSHWLLSVVTYYISFFFIPLIPTKVERFQHCPICNFKEDLAQSEFEEKKELAKLNQEAVDNDMSEAEYAQRLRNI